MVETNKEILHRKTIGEGWREARKVKTGVRGQRGTSRKNQGSVRLNTKGF